MFSDSDKETDDATASVGGQSAVSNALYELKKKSLYTAVVTEEYQWSSSPFGDFALHVCEYKFHSAINVIARA